MTNYRTYKYLIKSTKSQKEQIKKTFECCTYVYNKYIANKQIEMVRNRTAKEILTEYKKENNFLNYVDGSALMNVLFKLQDNRLNKNMIKNKKESIKSYTTTNLSGRQAIYFINDNFINIPKLGMIKIIKHRLIPDDAKIVSATITNDIINNYYACLTIILNNITTNKKIDLEKSIGLDYSSPHFFVDNNGKQVNIPHFLQNEEKKLSTLKNALAKCKKNSKNYYEIKNKIGKIYKKSSNKRLDYLHKLSASIANQYDIVCVEDLDMNEIASSYNLAKNTYDNGYGMFIQFLKYKLEEKGKLLIKIDKYYPSSKMCSNCGYIYDKLTISDREWICPKCHTKHDRDINAAINIRNRGLEEFSSIGYLD